MHSTSVRESTNGGWIFGLILAMSLSFLAPAQASAVTECERVEGCKKCLFSWWFWQDTCQDVNHDAYCSCYTGTETCYAEEGDCDYTGTHCTGIPEECPEQPN